MIRIGAKCALALAVATIASTHSRAATPIQGCQTIDQPGAYELTSNITGTVDSDCLVITTDGVTLDLAGFLIKGSGKRTGIVTTGAGLRGIAVRNGSVSGFSNGVVLEPTLGSIVEGVRVFDNDNGINAEGIVRNNAAANNRQTGINGIGTVTGNTAESNGGVGISAFGTVSGNFATFNGQGFFISRGSTVINNTGERNSGVGLTVNCPSTLAGNTLVENGTNLVVSGQGCQSEGNLSP